MVLSSLPPAMIHSLFVETRKGTMTRFYSQYPLNKLGLAKFIKAFSWPGMFNSLVSSYNLLIMIVSILHFRIGGFPSHVNAETPGAIHEGGELGYALAVAYGSIMDSPDLITVA
jgi:xylulose-5-phosphate/fructose-6-phosphate phosphoketolase